MQSKTVIPQQIEICEQKSQLETIKSNVEYYLEQKPNLLQLENSQINDKQILLGDQKQIEGRVNAPQRPVIPTEVHSWQLRYKRAVTTPLY